MTVTVRLTAATEPLFTGAAALFDDYRQHYGANPAPEAVAAWMLEQVLSTRARIYVACSESPAGNSDLGSPGSEAPGTHNSGSAIGLAITQAGNASSSVGITAPQERNAGRGSDDPAKSSSPHNGDARLGIGHGTSGEQGRGPSATGPFDTSAGIDRATAETGHGDHARGPTGGDSPASRYSVSAGDRGASEDATPGTPVGQGRGPVAYGICSVAVVPAALTLRTVWLVRDLFVVPAARHRGVARALLAHVAREARAAGAHRLSLQTETSNVRAIELYAKNGFDVLTDVAVMDRML